MDIVKVNLSELKPDPNNARKHSSQNILAIKQSLQENPQYRPFVVQKGTNKICVGNGMYAAMEEIGIKEGWVEYRDLDEKQFARLSVTDNRTAELAEWDEDILQQIISNYGDDITIPGFGDDVSFNLDDDKEITEDEVPEITEEVVSVLGDVWKLGRHRLMCGDSTDALNYKHLTQGIKVDLVFTDPPYNVDYSNIDRPKPSKHDLGKIKNDTMGEEDFYNFLVSIYKRLDEATKEDSSFYIWYADKSTIPFYKALQETNIKFNQMLIWKKPLLLGRNRYQYAHEPCIFGVKGSPYFTDDRTKTTVWDFGGYDKSKNVHPTQKPLFLPSEAIQNSSRENETVLDVFGGSGSTLIACEQLNRTCYMMELDPKYVDVIIQRYIAFKGTSDDVYRINADGTKTKYEDIT